MLENIEVSIPSKEYIEKSRLIKSTGFIGKALDNNECDYWTSTPSYTSYDNESFQFRMTKDGKFCHTEAGEICGVRPIIKADNLEEILEVDPFKIYRKGFKMIEFGKWYSIDTLKVSNLDSSFYFKGRYFSFSPSGIGIELDTNNGLYAVVSDEIHKVVPINWYYDEENDLLLSEKVLFESSLMDDESLFFGDFETTDLYKNLNGEFLSSLLDGINKDISQDKSEIIMKIHSLLEENEKLKEENRKLKESLEKVGKSPKKLTILN